MPSVTAWGVVSIIPLTWLVACSPDLHLLSDGGSFGGVDTGGEPSSAGVTSSSGVSAGSTDAAGGHAGDSISSSGEEGVAPLAGGAGNSATGGVGPLCTASGAELCNGDDDDCDGTVDEGCPGGLSTTFEKDLAALGDSPGGAVFADDCGHGQVLGGVHVRMHSFLAQVQGICRALQLAPSDNAKGGYAITLLNDNVLASHPASGDSTQTKLACPENEALIALRISQQHVTLSDSSVAAVIPRIWLSCAKLVLVEHPGENASVAWEGLKELAPASGSVADGTAWFASAQAEPGRVATRLLGASGDWIDRLGFGVSRIEVVNVQ